MYLSILYIDGRKKFIKKNINLNAKHGVPNCNEQVVPGST